MRISHATGDLLSLHGFLSSCVESTIHVLTLAFLCRPLLALCAKLLRCISHRAALASGFSPSPACMDEKRPLPNEESLSEALRTLCPFQAVSAYKFGLLIFWYVVAGHIALLYARGSDKRFAPFGYWYLVVLTLRLAYQVGVRQVAVRQVA